MTKFDFHDHKTDNPPSNPLLSKKFEDVLEARYERRTVLKGTAVAAGSVATLSFYDQLMGSTALAATKTEGFEEIEHGLDQNFTVAKGYKSDVLIRWGDKIEKGGEKFDPQNLSAETQEKQAGYNNDFIGYLPLPKGSNNSEHGLLGVNYEYVNTNMVFKDVERNNYANITKDQMQTEMAAIGFGVMEVKKENGQWSVVEDSSYNKRLSLRSTEFDVSGPAAGHDRLKTSADKTGKKVIGTISNCSGGTTPWGTFLSGEENFQSPFWNTYAEDHPEARNGKRQNIKNRPWSGIGKFEERFQVDKEPNEPNRFGWIIEIDPYNPNSTPVKRTALGRFKHEGAGLTVNQDGRVVIYMGDDQRYEYIYKYVSTNKFDPNNRDNNSDLLDNGTLYAAEFKENGKVKWHPLIHDHGPLTAKNGFNSQADVLIEARIAADLLGATPMDRPESVTPNEVNGKVYAALTKNKKRTDEQVNSANPRAKNMTGHIIEMTPPTKGKKPDHAALEYDWDIFIVAGNPFIDHSAKYCSAVSKNGWFTCPDNVAVDNNGQLWIGTDSGGLINKTAASDGIYMVSTEGDIRALPKHFLRVPIGAEATGPCFTPDNKTLFMSVQHPGVDGVKNASFNNPGTRWPDFKPNTPPRPSVVVITKEDGGVIGS